MEEESKELGPSDLGTLEFWENVYSRELDNFKDHGDVGEVWFGRGNSLKVIRWITAKLHLEKEKDRVLDIGCGNGMMLVELAKRGFSKLVGVDYSQKAIDLAKEVLKEHDLAQVELRVCDILADNSSTSMEIGKEGEFTFKLVHDKGTYDAISLDPEDPTTKRRKYIEYVDRILQPRGYFVLTSCNWTKEELEKHFEACKLRFHSRLGTSSRFIPVRRSERKHRHAAGVAKEIKNHFNPIHFYWLFRPFHIIMMIPLYLGLLY